MTRRIPRNRAQRDLDRPARERFATRTLTADCGAGSCRGRLYLPSATTDPPVVVMGPEVGADASFGLPAIAERFAAAGYAAFRFDYPGFGESDGDDQRIDPASHRRAYAAAVDRVGEVADLGSSVVAYGAGFAAAHALWVAGERRAVDAAMAITPILDGGAYLRRRGLGPFARAVGTGLRGRIGDAIPGGITGGRTVPIAGDAEERAVVAAPGAKRAYLDLVDRDSDWRNETPAGSLLSIARTDLGDRLADVRVPTLVLAGADDALAPAESVASAADRLPRGTYVRLPADHWSIYSTDFEPAVGHQLAFLTDVFED
ncbi:alpha/beta hydrolase [Halopenitus persicus]|uniref:Lysophospholipase, alpha-beta hydrolase superfamily n=1 Tax=Halopenitus persicus TaxID=1048396 RepID=A0A1H3KSG8_9EURY|nr:alpha/beta hydrolase [Halopenitus persicus]QHS17976.1 alpha/beta hydrolase [haloarchaeon 3A1-DGR]SDY55113.1 Lysophospholipase, alpha-beta hydrolase superfamily [Halopenitus persicus]